MCASDIELVIGKRIRSRREKLGLTQAEVGRAVGVRFQQIQRYEAGENRVSAVMVWRLSDVLDQPIEAFFPARERCS